MNEATLLRKIDEMCAGVGIETHLDGLVWPIELPGVKARVTAIQSPMLNLVGLAGFTEMNVDEGIQNVIRHYQQIGKVFGWLVGPTSQPVDLGSRLLQAGLIKLEDECMFGMVLRDLQCSIPVNPNIRVERVSIEDWDKHASMMAQAYGFGMTEEAANALIRLNESLGEQGMVYLAYAPDRDAPIAFSSSIFDGDGSVVTLGGAATLEEYRGQGVYSSMVAKRLQDARDKGIATAIIQAVKGTSAPICAKLGFETVCDIDFYVFMESLDMAADA